MAKTKHGPRTLAQFHEVCDEYAVLSIRLSKLQAQRDAKIAAINIEYQEDIDSINSERDGLYSMAKLYADDHRDELFPADGKTSGTANCEYAYRMTPPSLRLLNRSWDWDLVIEALHSKGFGEFVRMTQEPDKVAIKEQFSEDELKSVGLRIVQKDEFVLSPKADSAAE